MPLQRQCARYFPFIKSHSAAEVGHRRDLLNSLHQRAVSLLQGDDHAAQDEFEWLLKSLSELVINFQRTMKGPLVGSSKHFAERYLIGSRALFFQLREWQRLGDVRFPTGERIGEKYTTALDITVERRAHRKQRGADRQGRPGKEAPPGPAHKKPG